MQQFLQELSAQFLAQTWLDWAITVTALAYVYLAAKERPVCWVFGIISSGLWAWASFFRYNLKVDGCLQVFYMVIGMVGLYHWLLKQRENGEILAIRRLSWRENLGVLLAGGVLSLVLGFVFKKYTTTSFPYADSFITAFSIMATLLTVKKILDNWYYWIVFDALAILLFWFKGALLLALVMLLYTLMAVYGLRQWKRQVDGGR